MKYLFAIIFTCCSFFCFSQSTLKQFPKVTVDDFKSISCAIDSSAKAQILYDFGKTYFWVNNDRIEHVFEKTTRIQILDKSGYDYSKIEIPFYVGRFGDEEIIEFKATSYNYQDGVVETETVNKKALFEDELNEWYNRKTYAFSKVKEGTIIEYSYKITSPYHVHLRTWFFQNEIPVLKSKYKISLCPYYNYIVLSKGFMEYDFENVYTEPFGFRLNAKSYETRVYEWELNNVPAFKYENFVPSDDEYKMKVEFQLESYHGYNGGTFHLMTTWEQLIDELLEESKAYGSFLKSAKKDAIAVLSGLQLEGKSDEKKVLEIVQYVKNNFYWNKYNGLTPSQSEKNFIESKTGNVADINLFLHSLLSHAGIKSSPILISTRQHGKVYYQYPFLNLFNYVAVLVEGENGVYFLDGTDPLLPIGMLPRKCINEYGLQVKKPENGKDVKFFPLTPTKLDLTKQNQTVNLNEVDNTIESKTQMRLDGYRALTFRNNIKNNGIESIHEVLIGQSEVEIMDLGIDNLEDVNKPLILNYTTKISIDKIGGKVFITPYPTNSYKENKLKRENRVYPVDYGNISEELLLFNFVVPDDYKIDYTPESYSIKNNKLNLEFSYIVKKTDSRIKIIAKITRNKTKYEPSDYSELKTFYDIVVKNINENIVLKKI